MQEIVAPRANRPRFFPVLKELHRILDDLRENLKDVYDELVSGAIPHVRRVGELVVG